MQDPRELLRLTALVSNRALQRELEREIREMPLVSRYKLHKRARRAKALMKKALQKPSRWEYRALKAICKEYGRAIAQRRGIV